MITEIKTVTIIQNATEYTVSYRYINDETEVEIFYRHEQAAISPKNLTEFTIPETIEEKPVTKIGRHAFYNCRDLTSLIIPDKVTKIGTATFDGFIVLKDVKLGKGLTKIGDSAFLNCSTLNSIVIPEKVTEIGTQAFLSCSGLIKVFFEGKKPITVGNNIYNDANVNLTNYILEKNAKFWKKDKNGDFKNFGDQPVEIARQRVFTFLSNDSEKPKKSAQKFIQYQYFNLTINLRRKIKFLLAGKLKVQKSFIMTEMKLHLAIV